jgi:hypothetical protein
MYSSAEIIGIPPFLKEGIPRPRVVHFSLPFLGHFCITGDIEANKKLKLVPEEIKMVLMDFSSFVVWGATFFTGVQIVTSLVSGSLSIKRLGGALAIVFVLQALRFATVSRMR